MTTNNVSPAKLRKVMEQINLLIARADHPNTPAPEAEVSRQRAERLMFQYKVDEANLDEVEKARMGIRPTHRKFTVAPLDSEFLMTYRTMLGYVTGHVGARAVSAYDYQEGTGTVLSFDVFGFESDLAYAEVLWNSIRLAFAGKLEPDYDPALSDEENVYNMRNAGMERVRISEKMGWGGNEGSGPIKVTRVFKRACKNRGEDARDLLGKGNSMKAFRSTYAESFANTIWDRMWSLRQSRGQEEHGLVLANRDEQIAEHLYEVYPRLRPTKDDLAAASRPMTAAEKARHAKRQQRATEKWLREQARKPYSAAGEKRGAAAAAAVDIGGTASKRLQN